MHADLDAIMKIALAIALLLIDNQVLSIAFTPLSMFIEVDSEAALIPEGRDPILMLFSYEAYNFSENVWLLLLPAFFGLGSFSCVLHCC